MSEKEEKESGIFSQIRRFSRRLSGTFLDAKPGSLVVQKDYRPIYSHDDNGQMVIDGISVEEIAKTYGTPVYVYDVNRLIDNYNIYLGSLKNLNSFLLCYAVKANPNIALLDVFNRIGSGFDVVSGGEIARCLAAGVNPSKIVYSGCGKSIDEIDYAVKTGVFCINVESWGELERIEERARFHNKVQNVSIRINPSVNLEGLSHPNVLTGSAHHKFGVPINDALDIYNRAKASAHLKIKGISCHLGSSINQLEPFIEARDKLLSLADELRTESRIWIEHINLGGGFAAQIASATNIPDIPVWVEKLAKPITERGLKLVLEPGRSLVADAGVLLTKVEYIKRTSGTSTAGSGSGSRSGSLSGSYVPSPSTKSEKNKLIQSSALVVVDAGFNDMARTALYGAQHKILPVSTKIDLLPGLPTEYKYDIVGPICETTDIFAKDLVLAQKLEPGSLLALLDVGAYGSSMTSNYNSRNKPAEVLIHDGKDQITHSLIRERERWEEQYAKERIVTDINLHSSVIEEQSESKEDLTKKNGEE